MAQVYIDKDEFIFIRYFSLFSGLFSLLKYYSGTFERETELKVEVSIEKNNISV